MIEMMGSNFLTIYAITYCKLSIQPWIGGVSCDTNPWMSNSLVLLGGQGRFDRASFVLSL